MISAESLSERKFIAQAKPIAQASLPDAAGCYVIYAEPAAFQELGLPEPPNRSPLYVGEASGTATSKTVRGRVCELLKVRARNSLRLSLGAVLRCRLDLRPQLRSPTSKPEQHVFDERGEQRLTAWMYDHLLVVAANGASTRKALIRNLKPPLNLTEWANPYADTIQGQRAHCRSLASQ